MSAEEHEFANKSTSVTDRRYSELGFVEISVEVENALDGRAKVARSVRRGSRATLG